MGEQIFNFVLTDVNGIPALPVFIGNYLLDLLSMFFPILMIMASFVMVYVGLTKGGGDWKNTAQQIAPTITSIIVIIGLLSMKTPYSSQDGGNLSGDFWKETNSYTVVEMMNVFLDMGSVFAEALTHKIIYGSIDVYGSNTNGFQGYFPVVLQELINKKKEDNNNVKTFLIDKAKREDVVAQIDSSNQQIAANTKIIVNNLHNLGVVENYKSIRSQKENKEDGLGAYNYLLSKTYIAPYFGIATSGKGSIYYKKPNFPGAANENATIESTTNIDKENGDYGQFKGYAYKPDSGAIHFDIEDYFKLDSSIEEGDEKILDIVKSLKTFKAKSGSNRMIGEDSEEEVFSYLNPNNFEQEENMMRNLVSMLQNYKAVHILYQDEIAALENKIKSATKDEKPTLEKTLLYYNFQVLELKAHTARVASLYKAYVLILSALTQKDYTNPSIVDDINSVIGEEFYATISKVADFTAKEFEEIKNKYSNTNFAKINWYETDKDRYVAILSALNKIMQNRAFITNVFFDKYKDLLKEDTFFQAKLGFKSDSAYVRVFLPANEQNALIALDKKKEELINNFSGPDKSVAKTLEEEIAKNYSKSEIATKVIHWTELGKYYGTFKNIYSPMMNNMIALDKANDLDATKAASLIQFMAKLEPSEKTDRLLEASGYLGVAQVVGGVIKGGIEYAKEGGGKKGGWNALGSIAGGAWDAIKTIGGVYFAILFINVILPATIWMFVIISYYVEMSIYMAVFPIGLMFMIFQSYRNSLYQFINLFIGFMLLPIILVSMFFIVLYMDMMMPMFFKLFLPFFASGDELQATFSMAFGGSNSTVNSIFGGTVGGIAGTDVGTDLLTKVGTLIYTILSMITSVLLLLTFLRANEYMSKILNVNAIGNDSFNSRETMNKMAKFDATAMTSKVM